MLNLTQCWHCLLYVNLEFYSGCASSTVIISCDILSSLRVEYLFIVAIYFSLGFLNSAERTKKKTLIDAPTFIRGATAVAVGLPQSSRSMEGLESGEMICAICTTGSWWQSTEVMPANPHSCRPSPYLTSSPQAGQFRGTV